MEIDEYRIINKDKLLKIVTKLYASLRQHKSMSYIKNYLR